MKMGVWGKGENKLYINKGGEVASVGNAKGSGDRVIRLFSFLSRRIRSNRGQILEPKYGYTIRNRTSGVLHKGIFPIPHFNNITYQIGKGPGSIFIFIFAKLDIR
jgi:hypothetical protein